MDNQGGSQKGCSTIDMACKKMCTYELIQLMQYIVTNLDLDALACCDLMIEACCNLSCQSHGADQWYI